MLKNPSKVNYVAAAETRWAVVAQSTKLLSGLVATFLLSRSLDSDSLAAWFVFVSLFGVASLLEMGFGQVVIRHIAYTSSSNSELSSARTVDLIHLVEYIYRRLAVLIVTVGIVIACWMRLKSTTTWGVETAALWLLYLLAGSISVISLAYSSVLAGLGSIRDAQRNHAIVAFSQVCVLAGVLAFELALLGAVLSFLAAQCLGLLLNLRKVRAWQRQQQAAQPSLPPMSSRLRELATEAALFGVNFIGYQLLTSGFVLVYNRFADTRAVASYGLSAQLASAVLAIASAWSLVMVPRLAMHKAAGNAAKVRATFYNMLLSTTACASIGLVAYATAAPWILEQFGSRTPLLNASDLALLCAAMWVELFVVQFAHLLFTQGRHAAAVLPLLAAVIYLVTASHLLASGYELGAVLLLKIAVLVIAIGIPVIFDAVRSVLFRANRSLTF